MMSHRAMSFALLLALLLVLGGCPSRVADPGAEATAPPEAIPSAEAQFTGESAMTHVRYLTEEIGTRIAPSDELDAAVQYVSEQLIELGYEPEHVAYDLPDGSAATNLTALIPGASEQERLVVCHLDTVPDCPGANDDASGAAAMLEIAELLMANEPPLSVRLCFLTAEEALAGFDEHGFSSIEYMKGLDEEAIGRMSEVCWLDKIAAGPDLKILYINDARPSLAVRLGDVAGELGMSPAVKGVARWSEEMAFEDFDIPTAWVEYGPAPELHTPGDDMTNVDREKLVAVGNLICGWLMEEPGQ